MALVLALAGTTNLALAPRARAQSTSDQEDGDGGGRPGKHRRKDRRGDRKGKPGADKGDKDAQSTNGAEGDGDGSASVAEPSAAAPAKPVAKRSGRLFPPWPPERFDWRLAPIVAYAIGQTTTEAGTVHTTSAETGLEGGLVGIPIVPRNPGATLSVHAGAAFGDSASVTRGDDGLDKKTNVGYRRVFGGVGVTTYYKFVRNELDVSRGRISYDDDDQPPTQSLTVSHDLGILILGWLSGHYTLTYLRAYSDRFAEPVLTQYDNWLHARLAAELLDFRLDIGPGVTFATEYGPRSDGTGHEEKARGRTDDVRLATRAHLFWKVGANGDARYVYNASVRDLGEYADTRLPEEALHSSSSVALPEDSLTAAFFAGIYDLIYGIGVGWRYDVTMLNVNERHGTERDTKRSQGFGLTFSATL
jgi:hypothetical protein